MAVKTEISKKAIITALEKSLGVVTAACKSANISRSAFYEWYNDDPEFKNSVDNIGDVALDFAESQLYKLIKDGNIAAVIFYMKTKGRKRGYQEIMRNENVNSEIEMTEEELIAERERLIKSMA